MITAIKKELEKQVKKLTNYNLDFVSCRAEVINSSKVIPVSFVLFAKKIIIKYKNHSFMEPFLSRKNNVEVEVTMKIFITHRTINL